MAEGIKDFPPVQATLPEDRETILDAAVRFLQNPHVQKTSSLNQETFLRSKGLTDDEVKVVLQRAALVENKRFPPVHQSSVPLPPPVPERNYNVPTPINTASGNLVNSVIFVCGFTYGIYQFYKKYIHHVLFGDAEKDMEKDPNQEAIDELRSSLCAINDTLKMIHEQQQQQQGKRTVETFASAKQVDDLKAELASVKSLLLGRNQFASPTLQNLLSPPAIPSWQLINDADVTKGSEEETTQDCKDDAELDICTSGAGSSENDMATTNGSDSSMEMISKNAY